MYEGHPVSFDLVTESTPCFNRNSNRTVSTKSSFVRTVQFPTLRDKKIAEDFLKCLEE